MNMKMVDLKLPKKSKKEKQAETASIEMPEEKYPWGLQLRFGDESLDKLGVDLSKISINDEVEGRIMGKVIEVSQGESQGDGVRRSMEIQLTKIGFDDKNSFEGAWNEANKKDQ